MSEQGRVDYVTCPHGVAATRCRECTPNRIFSEQNAEQCKHGYLARSCQECTKVVAREQVLEHQAVEDTEYVAALSKCEHGWLPSSCRKCISAKLAARRCKHNEQPGECGQCLGEEISLRVEKAKYEEARQEAIKALEYASEQPLLEPCFHGIVGVCEQCQGIYKRKLTATLTPTYTRKKDIHQHVIGLLRIIIDLLEEA